MEKRADLLHAIIPQPASVKALSKQCAEWEVPFPLPGEHPAPPPEQKGRQPNRLCCQGPCKNSMRCRFGREVAQQFEAMKVLAGKFLKDKEPGNTLFSVRQVAGDCIVGTQQIFMLAHVVRRPQSATSARASSALFNSADVLGYSLNTWQRFHTPRLKPITPIVIEARLVDRPVAQDGSFYVDISALKAEQLDSFLEEHALWQQACKPVSSEQNETGPAQLEGTATASLHLFKRQGCGTCR